jgi:hypothetical protein
MSSYDTFVYTIFYVNMFALTAAAGAGLFVGGRKLYRKGQEACSFLVGLRDSFNEANRNASDLNRTLSGVKNELSRLNEQAYNMELSVSDLTEVERMRTKYEMFRDAASATYHLCEKYDVFNKLKDKFDDLTVVGQKIQPQPLPQVQPQVHWAEYLAPPKPYVCPRHSAAKLVNRASEYYVPNYENNAVQYDVHNEYRQPLTRYEPLTYASKAPKPPQPLYEGDWYEETDTETDVSVTTLPEKNPWIPVKAPLKSTLPSVPRPVSPPRSKAASPSPSDTRSVSPSPSDKTNKKWELFGQMMLPYLKDKLQDGLKSANIPVDLNNLTELAIKGLNLSGYGQSNFDLGRLTELAKPVLSQFMGMVGDNINAQQGTNETVSESSDEEPVSVVTNATIKEWPQDKVEIASLSIQSTENSPLNSEVPEIKEIKEVSVD